MARTVKPKPGQLIARWGKVDRGDIPQIVYSWGADGADKSDARTLMTALECAEIFDGRSLIEELEGRGYDPATLRFSIEQKATQS